MRMFFGLTHKSIIVWQHHHESSHFELSQVKAAFVVSPSRLLACFRQKHEGEKDKKVHLVICSYWLSRWINHRFAESWSFCVMPNMVKYAGMIMEGFGTVTELEYFFVLPWQTVYYLSQHLFPSHWPFSWTENLILDLTGVRRRTAFPTRNWSIYPVGRWILPSAKSSLIWVGFKKEKKKKCWGENWVYPLNRSSCFSYFHFVWLFHFSDAYQSWHWLGARTSLKFTYWYDCVLHANSPLTPSSHFPVSLYIPVSVFTPASLLLSESIDFSRAGNETTLPLRFPAGEGDPGRAGGRSSSSIRSLIAVFSFFLSFKTGIKRLMVRRGERGLEWTWHSSEKAEKPTNVIEMRKYFHWGIWLTAGLN